MQYWKTEQDATGDAGKFHDYRPRARAPHAHPSVVASGGSVGPFLRKFYRHQVVVSAPVQRFFLFLLLAGVIYAFVLGDGGAIRIAMLRHDRSSLDRSIAELQRNAALLESEIALLDSDEFYIEKTGRERYGYIRPGEKVYKIVPTDSKSK
ncbi:MAG TPA: septum formation initiator family protein [Candidatus Krumholzibacteria bacterium]|nr:septum formation initiator family protein [Candidatus Krumholzibacteria bacterium]